MRIRERERESEREREREREGERERQARSGLVFFPIHAERFFVLMSNHFLYHWISLTEQ